MLKICFMTKLTLVAVIAVQFVLLVHAVITIERLDDQITQSEAWFVDTQHKIEELRKAMTETKNLCEQYLSQDLLMPDYGNDQSR